MTELRIVGTTTAQGATSGEFAQLLANESPEVPIFVVRPTPGVIMGAAFDWTVILSASANVVAIAGGFWAAYRHFAKKHSDNSAPNAPQVVLQVRAESHSFVQIVINSTTTQEQFTAQMVEATDKLRTTEGSNQSGSVLKSYEDSPNEVRVHPRNEL